MTPTRPSLLVASFLLVVVAAGETVVGQGAPPGFTAAAIADVMEQARARKVLVLVDFSSDMCEPCRRLAQEVWPASDLQEWIRNHAVAIRVDPEQDRKLAERHRIDAYPTIVLLDAGGQEKGRIVGCVEAGTMRQQLEDLRKSSSTDWRTRQALADDLARRGDRAAALVHYLWLWDEGVKHNKSMVGVRGSFFLNSLLEFAKQYPPALAALAQRRDDAERRALAGGLDLDTVTDLVRLNDRFGEVARSLAVFEQVPPERWRGNDVAHGVLFDACAAQLVEAKRYQDIRRLGGDPQRALQSPWVTGLGRMPAEMRKRLTEQTVQRALPHVEALFGTREAKAAIALGDRLLELDDSDTTWLGLIRAARRAGDAVASQELATRALTALPEELHPRIRQALGDR